MRTEGERVLTKKQKFFLEQLKYLVAENGYFPTVREIGKELGLSSPATVHSYLNRLLEQGMLKRKGRVFQLVNRHSSIPIMGIVPAGNPMEIFSALGEEIELPQWMVDKGGDIFGLRVQGLSMIDAYIKEGDVVVVKKASYAQSGDMVIAYLEDSTITLKRYKKDNKKCWLEPENPEFESIYDPFQLVGKVIGVLRRYR